MAASERVSRSRYMRSGDTGWMSANRGSTAGMLEKRLWKWTREWTPAPRRQAVDALASAVARERWIIDGNFLFEEGDGRFDRADTVVFLDLPRRVCVRRVLSRRIRDRGRSRPDLPKGALEGFDLDLLRWIWRYPSVTRPRVLRLLGRLPEGVSLHHLRTPAEVRAFLESSHSTSSR